MSCLSFDRRFPSRTPPRHAPQPNKSHPAQQAEVQTKTSNIQQSAAQEMANSKLPFTNASSVPRAFTPPSNLPLPAANVPNDEALSSVPADTSPDPFKSRIPEVAPQNAPGFIRLAKDGLTASPYDHKSGNFSPLVRATTPGIDYGRSTPVPRSKFQKIPLANNPDVHNRMVQSRPSGVNQGVRMVGVPPNAVYSSRETGFMRAHSVPCLAGMKRNAAGQMIT